MALKYVTSEIQKNRNGPKKVTLTKTYKYLQSEYFPLEEWFSYKEFVLTRNKLLLSFPLKSLNTRGVFRTQTNIPDHHLWWSHISRAHVSKSKRCFNVKNYQFIIFTWRQRYCQIFMALFNTKLQNNTKLKKIILT